MPCDLMVHGHTTGTGSYVIIRQPEVCGLPGRYAMAMAEEPFAGGLGWLVDSACQGAWLFVSLACSTECDRVMVVKVYSRTFFF